MRNPLADKVVDIKPSGIRKFFDIVSEMQDAISLGVGEPDFDPEFDENLDFVLFRDHGKAIARPYYYFKKLMKKCNIDCTKHVWHDLRHTYATLLDQNNMNMKVVSEILGHYSEEFTNEVYVIHKPEVIIYDTSEVMNSFIESLKLDSTERTIPVYDISFIQEYLF